MDRNSANAARLRINRIALIHQLDTQELIPKLIHARIISSEYDVEYINQGSSKIDRARRLIDCLLNENTEHSSRPVNWYLLFRTILLENSSVYKNLVATLDHTKIEKPDTIKNPSKISSNQSNIDSTNENQEQVTNIQFDRYVMNKVSIEGSFQKVFDNLKYYSEIPEDLFEQLSHSTHSYDQEQFHNEQQVFDKMRRLELMINLIKTKEKSLSNQTIFDTSIMDIFLFEKFHQHYFYKYFHSISSIYNINYDQEFVDAFKNSLNKQNNLSTIIEKGFLLYHFLYNYGRYEYCRDIIESIVQTLKKQINKQQQPNIWIYLFRSCCALVQIHNQSLEIKDAWARIEAANEIAENLKATGIEITTDDYAWLYSVSSQTAYEDANFDACIQYSYRGLKLVNKNNHSLIIDLLCSLTQGLISKWIMNKAQATAIMAVQYAAKYCGKNSPKYIHALQQLVQYSNEFIQDLSSVELAQYTIDRARIIYGYESIVIAHCHRALSKSLITLVSIQNRSNLQIKNSNKSTIKESPPSAYLHHAYESYRIAQDWFGIKDRLRLFPFKMTLSHALQARIAANLSENKIGYFNETIKHLHECLDIAQNIFGSMSFKVAQVHRLQSATYLSNNMLNEAEQELNICLQIYKLCLPPNSFHYLVTKASLGLLYKQQGNYQQALLLFQNIAESLDTKTQSFRWINLVLESLIECYAYIESTEEKNSSRVKSAAEKIRSELYEWRQIYNIKRPNLMNCIHQEPTRSLQQFVYDSTKFQETTDRLHALIHTQQKAKNRIKTQSEA